MIILFSSVRLCSAAPGCSPPAGFRDTPHPAIAPAEQLVSHTEEMVIPRPFSVVSAAMNKPLEKTILKSSSLPGVSGDYMLTRGTFGAPGSRHIVCLTDGTSTEEEALEREDSPTSSHFRYIVWNYTTPKARPIDYGVGEFRTVQLDAEHTRITWTYAFKLKEDTFPGELGTLGRWLFKVGFLERDYAAMMKGVLQGYQETAEGQSAAGGPCIERLLYRRVPHSCGPIA
ncbi:MAG TPA: hypothetical protein VIX42_10825 [Edaphobacter sp.]